MGDIITYLDEEKKSKFGRLNPYFQTLTVNLGTFTSLIAVSARFKSENTTKCVSRISTNKSR